MEALVYIIILNYNGWKDTIECMKSIFISKYSNFKILIVDNCSTDDSIQRIETFIDSLNSSYLEKINFIKSSINKGFSSGNNLGIKKAISDPSCRYIWILNNDTYLDQEALSNLVYYMENSNKKIGILGSKLIYYHNRDKIQALGGTFNRWIGVGKHIGGNENISYVKDPNIILDYVVGAAMFVPLGFIKEVGLLPEDYFLYYEDVDWCIAAKNYGWLIEVCESSIVFHKEGGTIGSSSQGSKKSFLSDIESLKSRLTLTKKYYKTYLPTVYLGFIFVLLNRLYRKQFERVLPILKLLKPNDEL